MIDVKELRSIADAREIAAYIGIDVVRRGANTFILCPGHKKRLGREDTTIGNCVIYRDGYCCMACDPSLKHDVFDIVQEHTNCTFKEAVKLVADFYGGEKMFSSGYQYTERLPLSNEDLQLIGLKNSGKKNCPINFSYQHFEPENGHFIEKVNDEYLLMSTPSTENLITLRKESPKEFNSLIASQARIAYQKYAQAIKKYGSRNAPGAQKIYELFNDNGCLEDSVFFGIVNALKKKAWQCKKIYETYKEG